VTNYEGEEKPSASPEKENEKKENVSLNHRLLESPNGETIVNSCN
jgi:hypothetical protein